MPKNQYPHIIQLPGNALGKDFITTDPHGDYAALEKVIENYLNGDQNKDNRLFICGDLVDRGPDSLEIIRYVQNYNETQQRIYAVRGNHEDMVLDILGFLELLDAIENKSANKGDWQSFFDQSSYDWLIASKKQWFVSALSEQGNNLLTLAKGFSYEKPDGQKYFENFAENIKNQFSGKGGPKNLEIRNLFINVINAIGNGGGWVLNLALEERAEVKSFIEVLPYIIRVNEGGLNGSVIAPFDITHAAPLSEKSIEKMLAMEVPILSSEQIEYVTWARPKENCRPGDFIIQDVSRTLQSTVTYVGHNVLSAYCHIYRKIRVLVLDADTYHTKMMFIANHTEQKILFEPHDAESNDWRVQQSLCALRDAMSSSITIMADTKHADVYLYAALRVSQNAMPINSFFVPKIQEIKITDEDLRLFKGYFLEALAFVTPDLSSGLRCQLATYLLNYEQHPLSIERKSNKNKKSYSNQTHSMHEAMSLLLSGIRDSSLVRVNKSCFSTSVTIFGTGASSIEGKKQVFSRHRKLIK